jgi:hypothetical protein
MSNSDEKATMRLLDDIRRSVLLQPLADCTTHVHDTYPRRHHTSLGNAHTAECAYTSLFKALYGDPQRLSVSAATKAKMISEQAKMRLDWRITGTKLTPWPKLKFDNLVSRLLDLVVDLINNVLSKGRKLSYVQQELLKAETTEASSAARSAGSNMFHVCQEILTLHPSEMTDACQDKISEYVKSKYRMLADKLSNDHTLLGMPAVSDEEKAQAQASLDIKNKEYRSALTELQAIINHEMLLALGKLLPLAKHQGLVLPKLERAFSVHNQLQRAKDPANRVPYTPTRQSSYSLLSALALLLPSWVLPALKSCATSGPKACKCTSGLYHSKHPRALYSWLGTQ